MSVKSGERTSEMTSTTSIVKRRGRPKGAKNKPKLDIVQEEKLIKPSSGKRGRPKGSRNKPKQPPVSSNIPVDNIQVSKPVVIPAEPAVKIPQAGNHPLLDLLNWVEKKMHYTQMQYYQRRASKLEMSAKYLMASDILSLFSIQEPELLKTLKKNKTT